VGRQVLRELGQSISFFDKDIDVVVATHPDADHIGGLLPVLQKYKVDVFIEPGVTSDTEAYTELRKEVDIRVGEGTLIRIEARRGIKIDMGDGAILQILFPVRDPYFLESNTASIVARLVYGENEFLFTGDSPVEIERFLALEAEQKIINIDADVLKIGHHGSRTSTSLEYMQAVSPEYAIISVGKDNRYGHPHKEVLDILDKFGAKIFRTDNDGRVVFKSDGLNLEVTK
jgi:competence protein ComEC